MHSCGIKVFLTIKIFLNSCVNITNWIIQKISCTVPLSSLTVQVCVLLKVLMSDSWVCLCVFPPAEEVETLSSCTRSSCRHASVEADIELTQPAQQVGFICHQFSSEIKRKIKVLVISLFSLNQLWLNTPALIWGFTSLHAKPAAHPEAFSECVLAFSNNLSCAFVRIAAGQWIFTPGRLWRH